jgi:Flp pilus assembly protein TadG
VRGRDLMRGAANSWIDALRRIWPATRGSAAVVFALLLPAVAVVGCGAIDLASVAADRRALQDAADAAALDGAKQLGVINTTGVDDRTVQFAMSQINGVDGRMTVTPKATLSADGKSITVALDAHRNSFFANLIPLGGWKIQVSATAATVGETPLCVLTTSSSGSAAGGGIGMTGSAQMTAPGCLVQSNSDAIVGGGSRLTTSMTQTVGLASGPISPVAQTGAPPIPDPFSSTNLQIPAGCSPLDIIYSAGVTILPPGVHCGNIKVDNGATVQLLPGEHYFEKGKLQLKSKSTLTGSDVVLVFDDKSYFQFQDSSAINLKGRQSGPLAGFVIATTPSNTGTFEISSDAARVLLGTVYVPSAQLSVSGVNAVVADQSAWTVVVAKGLVMSGTSNLVINSAYAGSGVPVPAGVGAINKIRLTH